MNFKTTIDQNNFDLLQSKYNLKMNVLSNSDNIEFELLHNQEDLEAILNSMIQETVENPIFKGVLEVFEGIYNQYEKLNQDLIQRLQDI
jgi:hypothetical protein